MSYPLVSIIIPTYNRADLIGETLESIILQTYENWECIIIDDESTDNTSYVVDSFRKRDKRIQYYKRPNNILKGANACRNYGFELSKGIYINWFDSDDLMSFDFLETGISIFKNSKYNFVLFDFKVFKNNLSNIVGLQRNKTDNLIEDYAIWKINFGTWAIIWQRDIVKNYRFDEYLTRAQDLDFNLRIFFNEKFTFTNSNTIGLYLRQHNDNLTTSFNNNNLKSLKSEIKVRKYLIKNLILLNTDKLIIRKSIKILAISFVKLYRSGENLLLINEIKQCVFLGYKYPKHIIWYLKTRFFLFIYLKFKRGDLKLKKYLQELPFSN